MTAREIREVECSVLIVVAHDLGTAAGTDDAKAVALTQALCLILARRGFTTETELWKRAHEAFDIGRTQT